MLKFYLVYLLGIIEKLNYHQKGLLSNAVLLL